MVFETNNTYNSRDRLWIALFSGVPMTLCSTLATRLDDDRKISVLYGVILGVIGAAIGFGIWQVVKSKPAWFKIIILLILIPTCFTGVILIDNFQKPKFLTCEICGYKAVKPEGISCEYCASPIWAEVLRENPELLKEDWLREEQLWIFTPDSSAHKINFYEPAVASGFQKDNNWKPVVSEKDFN